MKKFFIFLIVILIISFCVMNLKDIIYKKIYVMKYEEYVEKYSKEYDVDKYLIYAIIKAESNFNEKVISNKGAKGLMQLMDSTAIEVAESLNIDANEIDILKPEININLGTKYFASLMKYYNSTELALVAYNAGMGNVDNWIRNDILQADGSNIENIPFKETKNYVRRILLNYEIYNKLYNE